MQPSPGERAAPLDDAGVIQLRGRHVLLREVEPRDYAFLHQIDTAGERLVLHRHRGVTPGPERFQQSLWVDVFAQFIVTRISDGEPLGAVTAYADDQRNGYARVAAVVAPWRARHGWPAEGWELFLNYLFQVFPFRKLYADVLEFNLDRFAKGLLRDFVTEGRFRDHEYFDGRFWDLYVLALYRDDWVTRDRAGLASMIREREAEASD